MKIGPSIPPLQLPKIQGPAKYKQKKWTPRQPGPKELPLATLPNELSKGIAQQQARVVAKSLRAFGARVGPPMRDAIERAAKNAEVQKGTTDKATKEAKQELEASRQKVKVMLAKIESLGIERSRQMDSITSIKA